MIYDIVYRNAAGNSMSDRAGQWDKVCSVFEKYAKEAWRLHCIVRENPDKFKAVRV